MQKYEYPAPGYPYIRMYWRYGGSFFGTMTQTNRYVKSYRNPKLEFAVSQPIWLEGEAKFADIILPACTNFERWDISEFASCSGYIPDSYTQTNNRVITFQKKCIEPLGESKSDYDIFAAVCDRLGVGEIFTMGGKDEYEWTKDYFHATDLPKHITWEEFEKKGYFVVPFPKDHKPTPALRWFAEDRVRDTPDWAFPWDTIGLKGLQTHVRQDRVRRQQPHAPGGAGRRGSRAAGHGSPVHPQLGRASHCGPGSARTRFRWSALTRASASTPWATPRSSWMNEVKDHRVLKEDGHYYWIMRLNTKDAADRGIESDDLIRAFNDRGSVILAARVTERVPAGHRALL